MPRRNEPTRPDPLAYFLTWTTYGTWLPGDRRGWASEAIGSQSGDKHISRNATARMQEPPMFLNELQRKLVEETITEHCRIRNWHLFAVNCRTNHVHVVVHSDQHPDIVQGQFKSWSTRRLKELGASDTETRKRWWSEGGSARYVNDEAGLDAAIAYVRDAQDLPR